MIHLVLITHYIFEGATDCQRVVGFNFFSCYEFGIKKNWFNLIDLFIFQMKCIVAYLNTIQIDIDDEEVWAQVIFTII